MDARASARQLREDLRQRKERYPELTTPEAQARLTDDMCTQTDKEGRHTNTEGAPYAFQGCAHTR